MIFATFLEELEARTAIEDCLKRFARAVDRQDWRAAREAYHEGAFDDHGFFKGPPAALLAHIAEVDARPNLDQRVIEHFLEHRRVAGRRRSWWIHERKEATAANTIGTPTSSGAKWERSRSDANQL